MVNKFNIHWQIARVNARKIKDVRAKLLFVLKFLKNNANAHNFYRVQNWLRMTKLGYSAPADRRMFDGALEGLDKDFSKLYSSEKDSPNDLGDVALADLKAVHKDLSKRTYSFQFKSTPPVDHVKFMAKLDKHIKERS